MKFNPNSNSKRSFGLHHEALAKTYLESQGLQFLEANFFARVGEIDLVMLDRGGGARELVFVEVRMRTRQGSFESAVESVGYGKLLKLRRTIEFFLLKRQELIRELNPASMRLDILGFDGESWTWVKNQGM